jgi:hypothetical protein
MTVIFHLTHAGKYYFVLYQFTLYNMSDRRREKPEAYKVICLVCEPMPVFLKNVIKNVDYNFSMTLKLPALFISDQKILSTCNEWKILSSDQLTFIILLLGVLAFSLGNLCSRGTGKPHPKKFQPTSHNTHLSFRLILHSVILYWPAGVEEQHYGKRTAWILHTNLKQAEQQGTRKY